MLVSITSSTAQTPNTIMTVKMQTKANTLGDWAAIAIKKHLNKIIKHEDDVLADKSPEALHQMRVGMRRLRSAITGFAPALDLPKPAKEKKIGDIARILGSLRDLDVLQEALQNQYKPKLPAKEKKELETVLNQLEKQRIQALTEVQKTLEKGSYTSVKQSLKKWLKQPQFKEIAQMPIKEVLPDLLLPEVSKLLLHPGWLVGTQVKQGEITQPELTPQKVEQVLAQGVELHNLRKATKRIRYQMEVFEEFYTGSYQVYLKDMKSVQEILGQIQDGFVLSEFMTDALNLEMEKSFPTLTKQLSHKSYQAWLQWQTLQRRYLNLEIRKGFHIAILQPNWGNISNGRKFEHE